MSLKPIARGFSPPRHLHAFCVVAKKDNEGGILIHPSFTDDNQQSAKKIKLVAMAFDHPVEADRVELNFGSIMARAPVIGSLMYLLGGHHAREEEEYESSLRKEITDDKSKMNSQNVLDRSNRTIKSVLKKSSPSLAPTDNDSDNESFQSALDSDRHNAIFGSESSLQRKKKELSWSDESGQNLVEYMDACTVSLYLVSEENAEYPSFRYRATKFFRIFNFLALTKTSMSSCSPYLRSIGQRIHRRDEHPVFAPAMVSPLGPCVCRSKPCHQTCA